MSKFSDKLMQLIHESGLKVYQIAKNSELDRTTIQRAMKGERLPSLNFVEKLSDYLRLSHSDRTELLDYYSISKIGDKVYEERKYIKEMIERIATIHTAGENLFSRRSLSFTGKINDDHAVYTGQYIVSNLIRDVLEDEVVNNPSPIINLSIPFNFSFLYDLLYQLYLDKNGSISIKNIISFNKNPHILQNPNYNLEILSHVMPFAFSAGNGYQPYYYYDNFDASNDIALLMPFYIITSNRVITLSADFKTAILYNDKSIVNTYKEHFDIAILKSVPLVIQHSTCEEILCAQYESYKSIGYISHVLEPQPCFACYYTEELIKTHLIQSLENREMILELLYRFYAPYSDIDKRLISIFSIEGLRYFAATGILADLPPQFATPFTLEERIMLMSKLKEDVVEDKYQVYAANPAKFINPEISIQLYNTKGVDFNAMNNNGVISSSLVKEKSIVQSFYDFFESLPGSDLIYNKEETVKIIDSFIQQCKSTKKIF